MQLSAPTVRFFAFTVAGFALVGCNDSHQRELNRLRAKIDRLSERVSQLEQAAQIPTKISKRSATSETSADLPPLVRIKPVTATRSFNKPSAQDIQQALKKAGFYHASVDGKMGPKTKQAIREFQVAQGLKADGIVGKQTWAKLSASL